MRLKLSATKVSGCYPIPVILRASGSGRFRESHPGWMREVPAIKVSGCHLVLVISRQGQGALGCLILPRWSPSSRQAIPVSGANHQDPAATSHLAGGEPGPVA
jgi:hypothetical protein